MIVQEPNGEESGYFTKLDQQLQGIVQNVVGQCMETMLYSEVDRQAHRNRHQRREKMWRELHNKMKWKCNKCGSQKRNDYRRNGSYARGLDTQFGHICFRMPQAECQCGGSVQVSYPMLKPHQRIWEDVRVGISQQAGLKMPLRAIKAQLDALSACLGGSIGLRTINDCLRPIVVGEEVERRLALTETPPPVLLVDGIWVTVMYPTGKERKGSVCMYACWLKNAATSAGWYWWPKGCGRPADGGKY